LPRGPLATLAGLPALHVDLRRRVEDVTPSGAKALRKSVRALRGLDASSVLGERADAVWTRLPGRKGWLVLLLKDRGQDVRALCHDLNAPLASAAGYADLLRKAVADPESARRADRLRSLLAYARDMIRHLAGLRSTPVAATRVEMKPLLDRLVAQAELEIRDAGARVEIAHPLPDVRGDGMRLARVFQNLLDNAIKFRGEEPPRVRIAFEATSRGKAFVVRDNGKGLSKALQKRIWSPLGRPSGSGLGLSIVREMVLECGGRLWLESRASRGTAFFLQLPLFRPT